MTQVEKVPMFEGVVSCFKIVCTSQFFSRTQYTCQRLIVPICVTRVQSQHCWHYRTPKNIDISTVLIFLFVSHTLVMIHVRTNLARLFFIVVHRVPPNFLEQECNWVIELRRFREIFGVLMSFEECQRISWKILNLSVVSWFRSARLDHHNQPHQHPPPEQCFPYCWHNFWYERFHWIPLVAILVTHGRTVVDINTEYQLQVRKMA